MHGLSRFARRSSSAWPTVKPGARVTPGTISKVKATAGVPTKNPWLYSLPIFAHRCGSVSFRSPESLSPCEHGRTFAPEDSAVQLQCGARSQAGSGPPGARASRAPREKTVQHILHPLERTAIHSRPHPFSSGAVNARLGEERYAGLGAVSWAATPAASSSDVAPIQVHILSFNRPHLNCSVCIRFPARWCGCFREAHGDKRSRAETARAVQPPRTSVGQCTPR